MKDRNLLRKWAKLTPRERMFLHNNVISDNESGRKQISIEAMPLISEAFALRCANNFIAVAMHKDRYPWNAENLEIWESNPCWGLVLKLR